MAAESGAYTPETIARRLEIAKALWAEPKQPIRHWSEGVNKIAESALGGHIINRVEQAERGNRDAQNSAYLSMLGVPPAQPSAPGTAPIAPTPSDAAPVSPAPSGVRTASPVQEVKPEEFNSIDAMASPPGKFDPNYQPMLSASNRSVANIESGSPAGNYQAIGNVTKTGDRAYGKHQVMGVNVGPWTKEVLGREMTPQEFLQNPDAQDAVFNAKFGQSAQKFGTPQDAASVWFTGKPRAQAGNVQDVNGTTAPAYVNKFTAGMPNASPAPAAPPTGPQGVAAALNAPPITPVAAQGTPAADDPKAKIAAMLANPNPAVQRMGQQMAAAYAQKHLFADPEYAKLDDGTLFNKKDGTVRKVGPGFKPLVDPAERAAHGIPADDKRPYQLNISDGKLVNPPAETRLNIDQRAESAFDTASAKHQAERFDALVKGGMEAKTQRADLGALREIGSRITTGKTAQITEALGPWAEALGVKIDGLGDMQAYEAIISKMAPRMRVAGSGATSDFEMRAFLKALPGLGTTPQGNAIIENTMEALQDHSQRAADIGSRAMNKEITPRDADRMLRELPDPLTAWKTIKNKKTLLPTDPATAPATAPADTQRPAAQPQFAPEDIEAEIKRRGLKL